MPKQDTELEEILKVFTTNIEHDGSYIPVSAIKSKMPEAKQKLLAWRDKSVNEARKENARLLNAVGLMYAQYCKKKLGHDFMGAGEAAIEILEDYEIHNENWEWTDKSYDKLEAVVENLNKRVGK